MFLIRYHNGTTNVVLQVRPKPTNVVYPEKRIFTEETTQDGSVVIQRPNRDHRTREWIWTNYPLRLQQYRELWETLETLDVKVRLIAGLIPTVEIWENQTGNGGFDGLTSGTDPDLVTYSNLDWTTVKIIHVTREHRDGGGPSAYASSRVVFKVVDEAWDNF